MDFQAELDKAELSQTEFQRIVEKLTGQHIHYSTLHRWLSGKRETPALAIAVVKLVGMLAQRKRQSLL